MWKKIYLCFIILPIVTKAAIEKTYRYTTLQLENETVEVMTVSSTWEIPDRFFFVNKANCNSSILGKLNIITWNTYKDYLFIPSTKKFQEVKWEEINIEAVYKEVVLKPHFQVSFTNYFQRQEFTKVLAKLGCKYPSEYLSTLIFETDNDLQPSFILRYKSDLKFKNKKNSFLCLEYLNDLNKCIQKYSFQKITEELNRYSNDASEDIVLNPLSAKVNPGDLSIEYAITAFSKIVHKFIYLIASSEFQDQGKVKKRFYYFKIESKNGSRGETQATLNYYGIGKDTTECIFNKHSKIEEFMSKGYIKCLLSSIHIENRIRFKFHVSYNKINSFGMQSLLEEAFKYMMKNNRYSMNSQCQTFSNYIIRVLRKDQQKNIKFLE